MLISWRSAAEALLLAAALSTAVFVACFAYGAGRIRIPLRSTLVITGLCTGLLAVSLFLGSLLQPWLPAEAAAGISFAVLSILGAVRLFDSFLKAQIRRRAARRAPLGREWRFSLFSFHVILNIYADPPAADRDASKTLSPGEAASLSLAMSLDGLAVGFGAGLGGGPHLLTLLFSLLLGAAAVLGGSALGNKAASKYRRDLSWTSGLLLLILAFLRLL